MEAKNVEIREVLQNLGASHATLPENLQAVSRMLVSKLTETSRQKKEIDFFELLSTYQEAIEDSMMSEEGFKSLENLGQRQLDIFNSMMSSHQLLTEILFDENFSGEFQATVGRFKKTKAA